MQHSQTIEHLFAETTTDYEHARIRTAIINWAEESNGLYEARTFEMDQSTLQGGAQIPQAIVSLPLLCFKHEEVKVNMYEVSLSWAFRSLFQTASHGGAYNNGHKAALGRLEAWISLAGLANAEDGASIQQVLQAAQKCQWFQFTTDTWFYNFVWDLGMIAIRPDQTSLAVLTATDTD
ncbi:DUF6183 family protein [Dictyobacter aurantiacus]|uniref:Uncharacterized protein n=1 Tax=Dictyobacter aurantiacus TaxID=1936993 RepID=A0A401ZMT7_9CHLR|nr:DUF6183 family protein [Dictyobacter aurantiacus]GCE08172.1 hypothetical protein KDAU_55010 [Dictyobacter aurantiacus]